MSSGAQSPDYRGAAEEQGKSSIEAINAQTQANRPNQYTPFGSSTWNYDPAQMQSAQWQAFQGTQEQKDAQSLIDSGNYDPGSDPMAAAWEAWAQTPGAQEAGLDYMRQQGISPIQSQTISLTPELQHSLDQQLQIQSDRSDLASQAIGRAQGDLQNPVDWNAMPERGQGVDPGQLQSSLNYGGAPGMPDSAQTLNQRGIDAAYEQYASRLDPQYAQREQSLQNQLLSRGLDIGDEAYTNAMANLGRDRNDAYDQARRSAVGQGAAIGGQLFGQGLAARQQGVNEANAQGAFHNQALQQQFGLGLQSSGYQNQLRQQAIAEELQRRGSSLNEANALLAGQQVGMPQMPSFAMAGAAQPVNYLGAAGLQGQMNQFNAQQSNQMTGGIINGAFNLGAAAMGGGGFKIPGMG